MLQKNIEKIWECCKSFATTCWWTCWKGCPCCTFPACATWKCRENSCCLPFFRKKNSENFLVKCCCRHGLCVGANINSPCQLFPGLICLCPPYGYTTLDHDLANISGYVTDDHPIIGPIALDRSIDLAYPAWEKLPAQAIQLSAKVVSSAKYNSYFTKRMNKNDEQKQIKQQLISHISAINQDESQDFLHTARHSSLTEISDLQTNEVVDLVVGPNNQMIREEDFALPFNCVVAAPNQGFSCLIL